MALKLYTFVKSYCPGSAVLFGLGGHSDFAVEKRWSTVTQLVADIMLGGVNDKRHPLNRLCGLGGSGSLVGSLRDSVCSSTSVTSDEGDELADEAQDARFHDECIVPKLNEEMRCPTCHPEVDQF
ncbi:uncharacterized protein IUM83_02636 [Phytophthora cinnamomi]|uniref:uncharacterized protein n=1 Tax=Phytophthora cinnamomi TaxID=4785 RepID=UPI00355AA720|nr:hypothetical protein IUM83_02636 [Phytophthora cinnamomi]